MTPPATRQTYTVIQALRGIAAMWVVLFHASEGGHIAALERVVPAPLFEAIFDAGHFGVAIFFALSGFVIAHGIAGATVTPAFFARFVMRRSVRLDPPYWVSIAITLALLAVAGVAKREAVTPPTADTLIAHLLYLQVILQRPEINTVYWTLTYEVQFYLFLVGMLMVRHRIERVWTGSGIMVDAVLFGCAAMAAAGWLDGVWPGLFVPLWGCFHVGVLANQARRSQRAGAAFAILAVILVLNGAFSAISALTAMFLWAAVECGWAGRGLNWRWLQFLGAISYSLYLIHNPVTGAVSFVVRSVAGDGVAGAAATLACIVAASVVAGWLLWRLVERPTHALARAVPMEGRLFNRMHASAAGR